MLAFWFQASRFRECGEESFRRRSAGTEAQSGTEETEGEVRADAAGEVLRLGRRR
jgi:hypothetical protein